MGPQLWVLLICVLAVNANSVAVKETTDDINTIENKDVTQSNNYTIILSQSAIKRLEDKLYNFIVSRKLDEAVMEAITLYGTGYPHVITKVVDRLIDDSREQVFDFAVKIIEAKARYIARSCFPVEIRMHEDYVFVQIVSHQYNMALKYGQGEDWYGDRTAYGDASLRDRFEITWKFCPEWHDGRIYFLVRPIHQAIFLKLGNSRDKDDDHGAYGAKSYGTDRHLWYVKPVRHQGKILFFIINKAYDEPLKLGQSTDSDGDRYAYGHSTLDLNPDKFSWELEIL